MDKNCMDLDGDRRKPAGSPNSDKVKLDGDIEVDNESRSLLPSRRGGILRKSEKPPRKVQWNDNNGNQLAEILEFLPSDMSDSDDEESDSCICTIM